MSKDIEEYGNEQRAEGEARGEARGKAAQAKKTAINLFNSGMTVEQIASAVDYSADQVKEWVDVK